MIKKHAYIILAHKDDYTFYSLLKMLDHEKNDIFIHMDAKNKSFNETQARSVLRKSNLFYTQRTNVTWGGYSMINAELQLLKCATLQGNYLYYHLLSGEDLPIKTQDDIHDFFEEHQGKEFVRFECNKFQYYDRVRYYYWFQELVGRQNNLLTKGLKVIQKLLRVHRNKNIVFQKGAQWFSITDELARYVISQEKWIKKVFNYTTCCDEVFLQTLIINSDFKQNLVKTDFDDDATMFMRMIDWKRGTPYTFRINDWKMLEESDMLFARKFAVKTDKNIINKIVDQYGNAKSNRSEVCENVK